MYNMSENGKNVAISQNPMQYLEKPKTVIDND